MSDNYGFEGIVPLGASVSENIARAKEYQSNHTPEETFLWFYNHVRNNSKGHLPLDESMDYKQIDLAFEDFGNFNYGAVGRALGIPDIVLDYGAGWAQGEANGLDSIDAVLRALLDPINKGDNPGDQDLINQGYTAARERGFSDVDIQITKSSTDFILKKTYSTAISSIELTPTLIYYWHNAKYMLSPLILDLDGDGLVETQSKTEAVYFDHAGDGFAEATGWAGSDDGLLVRDLNGDGSINNGAELFGNNTRLSNGQKATNGFEALADLDSNRDGKINSADTAWHTLRVWKDIDADAQTDAGELLTLAQAGVQEVNLAYTKAGTNPDEHGNEHQQTGSFTTTAGTTQAVHDVWFTTDNWKTIDQRTPLELSGEVAAMPELMGSGTLGSLNRIRCGAGILAEQVSVSRNTGSSRDDLFLDLRKDSVNMPHWSWLLKTIPPKHPTNKDPPWRKPKLPLLGSLSKSTRRA